METSFQEIIKLGETQRAEFKKSLSLQREALETLCGMINTDYAKGMIIFGVKPDNSLCGIDPGNLDTAQMKLVRTIREKFEPSIHIDIDIVECEGKNLLILKSERDKRIPYHEYDGRAYIREGTSTRQLSYDEKRNINKSRDRDNHNGPWKCNKCGTFVGMLSSVKLTDQGIVKTYECECGGEFWPIK